MNRIDVYSGDGEEGAAEPLEWADGHKTQEVLFRVPVTGFLTQDEIARGFQLAVRFGRVDDTLMIQKFRESQAENGKTLRYGSELPHVKGADNMELWAAHRSSISTGRCEYPVRSDEEEADYFWGEDR